MKLSSNILVCLAVTAFTFITGSADDVVDICSLPRDTGPCEAAITRYYFNSETSQCEKFLYGGCKGNSNNFASFHECDGLCGVCTLPNDPGPCDGTVTRYFFNTNTGVCEKFTYGGCEGNANKFDTLDKCKRRCGDVMCFLPRDPGLCNGSIQSYYFDAKTLQCEKFIYGGCSGNANNFETLKQCQSYCHG